MTSLEPQVILDVQVFSLFSKSHQQTKLYWIPKVGHSIVKKNEVGHISHFKFSCDEFKATCYSWRVFFLSCWNLQQLRLNQAWILWFTGSVTKMGKIMENHFQARFDFIYQQSQLGWKKDSSKVTCSSKIITIGFKMREIW